MLLLAAIFAVALISVVYTTALCDDYDAFSAQMEKLVESGDWTTADKLYKEMAAEWDTHNRIAPILFHKEDVHNVSDNLGQLRVSLLVRDRELALQYIEQLSKAFETIREFHTPTLQSVF